MKRKEMVYTPTDKYPDVYRESLLSDLDRNRFNRLALFITALSKRSTLHKHKNY
jgi:hypothetical protein